MRPLTDSTARVFRELWKSDPLRAAHWVSDAAAHAHVETEALKKLRGLLALEGSADFDAGALRQLAKDYTELAEPLGSLQAARGATLGWSADDKLDAPTYTGTVRVIDDQVQLTTPLGTFALAAAQGAQWTAKWAAEAGAFANGVVTVRGWPDKSGGAIAVESFGPGSSPSFVQGRVTRTEDGHIALQERPDKLVKITNPELAARLERFMRVAFILPGEAKAAPRANGQLEWRFDDDPKGYYMLTKLNPGDERIYDADTPFEKTHVQAANGHFPVDKLGHRVFVFGQIADEHEGVVTDRVRKFTARWVSEPILPAWQKAAEAKGRHFDSAKSAEVAVVALDPRLEQWTPAGAFEPEEDVAAQAARLAKAWGVEKKNGTLVHQRRDGVEASDWEIGKKRAAGPLDGKGRKHGTWSEFRKEPGRFHEVALQGRYEHGVRQGVWVQFNEDGTPANAWEFKNGKLAAAGHVDDQLRPHGAWTLVGQDGLHDGGEGAYDHGVRVGDWWYYKPGTSDYERAEVYHPNGVLAAEGKTQLTQVGNDKYDLRVGEWRLYDEQGALQRTVIHTTDDRIDGNGEQVGGKP